MTEVTGALGDPQALRIAAVVALVATIGCVVCCWLLGSPRAALCSLLGAVGGVFTQGVAVWFLLRSLGRATVGFLGAFALASLFRVFGGALVVLLALVCDVPEPIGFFAGFATLYVALEVVTDVLLVRSQNRMKRMDRAESG